MKLNLGCGHTPMPGFVNVDLRPGEGVDELRDLDAPDCLVGIAETASIEAVEALGLLEHLPHYENLVLEVARVLAPGGLFHVRVPFEQNCTMYHVRFFDRDTFNPMLSDWHPRNDFFLPDGPNLGSLEFGTPYFHKMRRWVEHRMPLAWHIERHTKIPIRRMPFGRPVNLEFHLRRNDTPWRSG